MGLTPVPVEPSPKFHAYDAMVPSMSLEPVASKLAIRLFADDVNDAVGGTFAAPLPLANWSATCADDSSLV